MFTILFLTKIDRLQGRCRLGYSLEERQALLTSTTRAWAVRKSAPRMGLVTSATSKSHV